MEGFKPLKSSDEYTKQEKFPTLQDKRNEYEQNIRNQKRTKTLQEKRQQQPDEEEKEKFLASINERISANISKMDPTEVLTDANIDAHLEQLNHGVSKQELQAALKIRADRLSVLWEAALEELPKLQQSLKVVLDQVYPKPKTCFSAEEVPIITTLASSCVLIKSYLGGIRLTLGNLKGGDHDKRSIAILSSGARHELLVKLVDNLSQHNFCVDLKPLQALNEKLKLASKIYS